MKRLLTTIFGLLICISIQAQTSSASIARAILTSGIEQREPADKLSNQIVGISGEVIQLYFFTQIVDQKGSVITHRWLYQGEVVADVQLNIGSHNWRTYSSKKIMPQWRGDWTVQVLNSEHDVLFEHHFTYSVTD